jgi:putative membrane protein
MFHDYITLLLVNMAAGLVVLALFFLKGMDSPNQRFWTSALAIPGLVAFVVGLHMTLTWPAPKLEGANLQFANIAFGEMSVLFGALFLGVALSAARHWSLVPLAVYAIMPSAAAILVGIAIEHVGLTKAPSLTCAGYLLTAAPGLLALPMLIFRARLLRIATSVLLLLAAAVWLVVGLGAYWDHLAQFAHKL